LPSARDVANAHGLTRLDYVIGTSELRCGRRFAPFVEWAGVPILEAWANIVDLATAIAAGRAAIEASQ